MLQEAGDCPVADYVVYDDHEEEEVSGSGVEDEEEMEELDYEYTYDAKSDKASVYISPFQFNKLRWNKNAESLGTK